MGPMCPVPLFEKEMEVTEETLISLINSPNDIVNIEIIDTYNK